MTISPESLRVKSEENGPECAPCVAEAVLGSANRERLSGAELAEKLEKKYPLTVAALRQMEGGLSHLEYITALEERWGKVARGQLPIEGEVLVQVPTVADLPKASQEFDLIYCGGVLGLFSAAVLAQMGRKVMVFDQRRVGTSHREWNISDDELAQFVEVGLFSREELEKAIAGRYERGLVKFYGEGIPEPEAELWLDRVLDVAIDLGTLLEMARSKFEAAGGVVLDYRAFRKVYVTEQDQVYSVVEVENREGQIECYKARLTINALGAISPLSLVLQGGKPFDGVCPTVGSTARGFKFGTTALEVDPTLGDVLVSVAHAQKGRQLIWEGFPGKDGEMTVYVFYYDLVSPERAAGQSLLDLFEDYFELLPSYKELDQGFAHLKPVYGYIPARHHRPVGGSASRRGILSVGDATSPQSSLTFCGFGSQVRNLPRLAHLIDLALRHDLLEAEDLRAIGAHQTNINQMWVFSRFMQPIKPGQRPNDVNRMMNVFCASLNQIGPALTRRFFQDRIGWRDYNRVILTTAWRYPRVFPFTLEVLGLKGIGHWATDYLIFSREALLRTLYQKLGAPGQQRLHHFLEKRRPKLALALAASYEEWVASGLLKK